MKKVNHFISGRGAMRVLALALLAQLAFATAGSERAQAQNSIDGGLFAGNALTWVLWDNYTLTINGTGAIPNAGFQYVGGNIYPKGEPWVEHQNDVVSVIIASGVTDIGEEAFSNHGNLTSVNIGESVTDIKREAFYGCTELETVNFAPLSSLKVIGEGAFLGCTDLTSIAIPASVTDIRQFAFMGTGLQSVTFAPSSSLVIIGEGAFAGCDALASIDIPESVTAIGQYAFGDCDGLTDIWVNWTSSPPTVNADVFDGLTLSDITLHIPAGSEAAYASGVWTGFGSICTAEAILSSSLTWELCNGTLTISGTGTMPDYGESNPPPWYPRKDEITDVIINPGVESVGNYAFYNCTDLASVSIAESVTAIGDAAFLRCNLSSVDVPKDVAAIGAAAFGNNANLTAITVDPDNTYFKVTDGVLFSYDDKSLVLYPAAKTGADYTVPALVETLRQYAFDGNKNLTSVSLPASLTAIETGAFADCDALESVNIPASVTAIGQLAFGDCDGLTDIWVNWTSSPPTVTGDVFDGLTPSDITLHLPAGANQTDYTSANWPAFNYVVPACSGPQTFAGLNTTWELCNDGTLTISGTGAMPNFSNASDQPWASDRENITSVVIVSGVTTIGDKAFEDCSALASVTISTTSSVDYIGVNAFYGCTALTSVSVPASVTFIAPSAFSGCDNLTAFTVDPGNTNYSNDATGVLFNKDQTALIQYPKGNTGSSYTIPASVVSIAMAAFSRCYSLTDITVNWTSASDIPNINYLSVFFNVTGNITLYINGGLNAGDYTSANGWNGFKSYIACTSGTFGAAGLLTWTLCGGTLTIEGSDAMEDFANYTLQPWASNRNDITDIIIEEGVTSVGDFAFNGCDNLESVSIPASTGTIGESAFAICGKLETVNFAPSSLLTDIGVEAFQGCSHLESIDIPASVTSIGESAFFACVGFESVNIPASVGTIGANAFAMCTALETVNFAPSSVLTDIRDNAFGYCGALTSINIPASVAAIGASAFGNGALQTVTVHWTSAGDIPDINGKDVFDGLTLSFVTLNVPAGADALYEAAPVWQEFNIAGQSAAILTLSQTALSFSATAGSQTVNLTANVVWTAVSPEAWLTVSPLSASGDAVLTISATANTGSSARTGIVTVSDGGSLTPTVTVTQAAAVIIVKPSVTTGLLNYDLSPVAYDGQPHPVAVTPKSGVTGLGAMTVTYNGLSAPPVEAGDYIVTFIFDEGAGYAATTLEPGVLTITSAVGNTALPASGIWTSDGAVHIAAASAGTVSVYDTVGHLVATRSYTSGETVTIPLPKGVYFILSEGKSCKVIIRD